MKFQCTNVSTCVEGSELYAERAAGLPGASSFCSTTISHTSSHKSAQSHAIVFLQDCDCEGDKKVNNHTID